ncbi:MAG: alanine racemase [Terracidiphilus sp.]|nr:alanine racemase [Terracidiphilus sp.]MDR3798580.1 alanine racemase [Terracidiphilus sp.]
MPMRPCWVEIRTRALEENMRFLASLAAPHAELLAMVKANAYGHSLALCAPAAVRGGAGWLGVTSVEEGIAARALCPDTRVLIMSGIARGQAAAAIQFELTPIAWELWQLDELESAARAAGAAPGSFPVHLEIDTGMSRQGVLPGEISSIFSRFAPGSPLRLEGVMTHLYAADEADGQATHEQLARLDNVLSRISAAGLFAEWLNVGNSPALLAGQAQPIGELAARHGMKALLRPGLALFGVVPEFDPAFDVEVEPPSLSRARAALKPVLTWKSAVVGVRSVPAGASVGYNGTFVATEPMRLALIAVGYADGLVRSLGNRFHLLVRGQRAPLVGRVSMDQSVVDVTDIPGVVAGDEVVLIGKQGDETISSHDHARATGTIPWEVFTRIGPRVARTAV